MHTINGKWIDAVPNEKELKRLNVDELIRLCKYKRSFKKVLLNYLLSLKEI